MATLKYRLNRKNASGTYDTIHYETSSNIVMRPSGRTVEQDLADFLPRSQNTDDVPQSLTQGLLQTGSTKAWIGGFGEICPFGLVSDGKKLVANAITGKGVTTSETATFATMAENIEAITTGTDTSDATAAASQILSGYTAYVKGSKITGSMVNRGSWSSSVAAGSSVTIPAGYHSGSGTVVSTGSGDITNMTITTQRLDNGITSPIDISGYKFYIGMSTGKFDCSLTLYDIQNMIYTIFTYSTSGGVGKYRTSMSSQTTCILSAGYDYLNPKSVTIEPKNKRIISNYPISIFGLMR